MARIINRKDLKAWKILLVVVVELFITTQILSFAPALSKDYDSLCRRSREVTTGLAMHPNLVGISGIVPFTQTVNGVDYDILLDTENGEVTIIKKSDQGEIEAVEKLFYTDEGNTGIIESREDGYISVKELVNVGTEEEPIISIAYRSRVKLTENGDSLVEIYDNDSGEDVRLEVTLYSGSEVYDRVEAGEQLLEYGAKIAGTQKNRVSVKSFEGNNYVFDLFVDGFQASEGAVEEYTARYSFVPVQDGIWKVSIAHNDSTVDEFLYEGEPDASHIMMGFDPEKIVPHSLRVNGEFVDALTTIEGFGDLMTEVNRLAAIEAGEEVTEPLTQWSSINSRSVRRAAQAVGGAMVGIYAAAHMPFFAGGVGVSELATLCAHAGALFPMYVALNKFTASALVSLAVKPERYDIESNQRVLDYRFSDEGFDEGLALFYTCKTEGSDWARSMGNSIKGNIVTLESLNRGAVSETVMTAIKTGIAKQRLTESQQRGENKTLDEILRGVTDLDVARELNKNLYLTIVTDGNPSNEDFLEMVSLVHKLRAEYGRSVQILFSARRAGERLGFKPGAYQDAIGLFTRGMGPRIYEGKTYTDESLYGPFARVQNDPIFGIFDSSFKARALEYYKTQYNPTAADLIIFEDELNQLEDTGWISGYYGENSTIAEIVQEGKIDHLFTLDSGNFIGVNQAVEMAAKVATARADSRFDGTVMFQPDLHVANPQSSLLTDFFNSAQERFYWHNSAATEIRTFVQSTGKVWIVADAYAEIAMQPGNELTDPWEIAHDWHESGAMKTVQVQGVFAYETRYITYNETKEVTDGTYLGSMSRFLKSNDMNFYRSIYARHGAYRYIVEKLGMDLKPIELPDDPVMAQQALEVYNDASWFCRAPEIYSLFLGLTIATGAISSAFAQTMPVLAGTLLATVLIGQLILMPQVLAPAAFFEKQLDAESDSDLVTIDEQAAEEFMAAFEDTSQGNWDRFLATKPAYHAKQLADVIYDIFRSNELLMPIVPIQVLTRRINQAQIARTAVLTQQIINLVREGYTVDAALDTMATEIDSSVLQQFGIDPRAAINNIVVQILDKINIEAGEVYHITESDIKSLISPGSIYTGFTPSTNQWRAYSYFIAPVIGAALIGLPILLSQGAFTLALSTVLGLPYLTFGITNYLTNKSAKNMNYVNAIADVETRALGDANFRGCIGVGDALFMAHREDSNHDYTERVKWMAGLIEDGGTIDEVWEDLNSLEKSYLRTNFSEVAIGGISSLTPEELAQIDIRVRNGLLMYIEEINKAVVKYRDREGWI
ncbi:MAG: hypothetical protein P9L98_02310 [Candidatus Kaelpia imicola]|nr:hypothetical protein [Candidatus Kaelpia imicola]